MTLKYYKCSYKYCQHESCDVSQDEAVKYNNRYMHKDCYKKNEMMVKTRDLYYEKVSSTVVMKQLVSVINNLVLKKEIDPSFLYFALDFAINNKIPIRSPYGLHYLIDNNRIKDLWKKKKSNEIIKHIKEEVEEVEVKDVKSNTFNYSANKDMGFGGIFRGGI